ncbi:MAG: TVP38/TMEM64 family protein [Solirubrobacteraceae bacterium]
MDETPDRSGRVELAAVLALAAILTIVVLTVPALHDAARHAVAGDTDALRRQLHDLGAVSLVVLVVLMLVHVVVWYPSEIVTAAAGFVYGFWLALPLVLAGWLLSALASYALGRYAGRPLLYRIAGQRRFERAEAVVARGGWPMLMAARLVPIVPFSLIGYVAGAARTSVWTFSWTTVIGFLPLSIIVTLLGSRLQSLSLEDPVLLLALIPVALILLAGRPLVRRLRLDES